MPRVYDAIVIGATVAGLTCATKLANRGVHVAVLDPAPAPESASVGHGVLTSSLGDDLSRLIDAVGPDEAATRMRLFARAMDYVNSVADCGDVARQPLAVAERTLAPDGRLDTEARVLRAAGFEVRPATDQPFDGVSVRPGFEVAGQLALDPHRYGAALHDRAEQAGVTLLHNVTVTRFRRHQVLHAVHYRSQLAWEHGMLADWASRVIDTQAVSPWGRHARSLDPLVAPVVMAEGIGLDAVVALRDTPARLVRPWADGVLVVGHPVPPAASETATVGLRHWLTDRLGLRPGAVASFGIEPDEPGEPREGAAVILGGFWAGGNGLWELGFGTISGLALAGRLLGDVPEQRLPVLSRLRARINRARLDPGCGA